MPSRQAHDFVKLKRSFAACLPLIPWPACKTWLFAASPRSSNGERFKCRGQSCRLLSAALVWCLSLGSTQALPSLGAFTSRNHHSPGNIISANERERGYPIVWVYGARVGMLMQTYFALQDEVHGASVVTRSLLIRW